MERRRCVQRNHMEISARSLESSSHEMAPCTSAHKENECSAGEGTSDCAMRRAATRKRSGPIIDGCISYKFNKGCLLRRTRCTPLAIARCANRLFVPLRRGFTVRSKAAASGAPRLMRPTSSSEPVTNNVKQAMTQFLVLCNYLAREKSRVQILFP
jgi:hypothetical protein